MSRLSFIAIVLIAASVRLLVLFVNARHESPILMLGDSRRYVTFAETLRTGGGFLDARGDPTWATSPGYPLFLATIFATGLATADHPQGAIYVQLAIGSLIVGLSALAGSWLSGGAAATLVGILLAVEPSGLAYPNVIMSETLFSACLLAAVFAWRRWLMEPRMGTLLMASAVVGLLPLVRSVAFYLPLVLAILVWRSCPKPQRPMRAIVVFLVLSLTPAACWSLRNLYYVGSAELEPRTPRAMARFARGVDRSLGIPRPSADTIPVWDAGFGSDRGLSKLEAMKQQRRYFWETIRHHPSAAMRQAIRTPILLAGTPEDLLPHLVLEKAPTYEEGSVVARVRWLLDLGPFGVVLALGMGISLGGLASISWNLFRQRTRHSKAERDLVLCIVSLVLYVLAFSSLVPSQGARYRAPVMPLLAILLVSGLSDLALGVKGARARDE